METRLWRSEHGPMTRRDNGGPTARSIPAWGNAPRTARKNCERQRRGPLTLRWSCRGLRAPHAGEGRVDFGLGGGGAAHAPLPSAPPPRPAPPRDDVAADGWHAGGWFALPQRGNSDQPRVARHE